MPQEEVANSLRAHWEAVRRECAHCSQNPNRLPVQHCLRTAWLQVTVSTPSLVNNECRHCLLPNHANTHNPRHDFLIFFPSLSFPLSFLCPQRQEKLMWTSKKEEFVLDNLCSIQDVFKRMTPLHLSQAYGGLCVYLFSSPSSASIHKNFFLFPSGTPWVRKNLCWPLLRPACQCRSGRDLAGTSASGNAFSLAKSRFKT